MDHRSIRAIVFSAAVLVVVTTSGCTAQVRQPMSVHATAAAPFRHPGILVNQAQLDFITQQVNAGVEPWKSAFDKMASDPHASLSYTAHPWDTVECGVSSNPNHGCSDERNDALAAYTHALIWYITGNKANATKAVEIMNAWASTLTGGHTNSNAPLQAGWTGSVWPEAAEIINYTYDGWSNGDIGVFQDMLMNQYLPNVIDGAPCKNGNWELVMAEATMHIGVFNDDRDTFDKGVALWRGRVPAYMYLSSDGSLPKQPPGCKKSKNQLISYWEHETTFVDGIAQETCRDFGHTLWGISAAVNIAETALQQGLDLYSEATDRIKDALEFHADYLLGKPAPDWLCGGSLNLGTIPAWEIAYNHLHNRLGLDLPLTQQYIETKIRPSGVNYFIAWETLTHADVGNVGLQ